MKNDSPLVPFYGDTMFLNLRSLLLCGLVSAALSSSAVAQDGFCGSGGYLGGAYFQSMYGMEHVPYYALHPPVYYSYPIPRSYGYSPFAYPPGTRTPEIEIELAESEVMVNPYVPQSEKPTATTRDKTTQVPLQIINPFVANESRTAGQVAQAGEPTATKLAHSPAK